MIMALSNWEITLRLLLAAAYGILIGMERHQNGKPVGRRTHALICVAGSMIAIIGLCGFENMDYFTRDPTRLPVGVLTGLGFLGAGVIWQDKGGVRGLTTAATVYATACVGLSIGFGYYYLGTLATALIVLILCSGRILSKLDKKNRLEQMEDQFLANSKDERKRTLYQEKIKEQQNTEAFTTKTNTAAHSEQETTPPEEETTESASRTPDSSK